MKDWLPEKNMWFERIKEWLSEMEHLVGKDQNMAA